MPPDKPQNASPVQHLKKHSSVPGYTISSLRGSTQWHSSGGNTPQSPCVSTVFTNAGDGHCCHSLSEHDHHVTRLLAKRFQSRYRIRMRPASSGCPLEKKHRHPQLNTGNGLPCKHCSACHKLGFLRRLRRHLRTQISRSLRM